ncbi:MAG: sel1 repeat family protein [Clostridia bacterium]|nr:sel1 repeat family protein [Clostridia bacterium]
MTDYDEMDYLTEEARHLGLLDPSPEELMVKSQWAGTIDEYLMLLIKGHHQVCLRSDLEKHLMDVLEDEWFLQWPLIRLSYASRLLRGTGCRKSVKKAVEILLPLAEKGYPGALYDMGECYMEGWGVEQSYPKAIDCWLKAGHMGYTSAQQRVKESFFADYHRRYLELPLRLRLDYLYESIRLYMEHHYATVYTISDKLDSKERIKLQQACREIIRCEKKLPLQQYLRDAASLIWDDDENPYKLDV